MIYDAGFITETVNWIEQNLREMLGYLRWLYGLVIPCDISSVNLPFRQEYQ